MSGISHSWYATNGARMYPCEDHVSLQSNDLRLMPEGVIVDLKLVYQGARDSRPYLSAVSYGNQVASLIIADQEGPIAAATRPVSELSRDQPTHLSAIRQGTRGAVVFGHGEKKGEWIFNGPQQSGLLRRTYTRLDVPSQASRFYREGLAPMERSLMQLAGRGDIRVTRATRIIAGQVRDAIVVELNDNSDDTSQAYTGEAGRRPESQTCEGPQPIEQVNNVKPDCCGRLFIEFRGNITMTPLADRCGVLLQSPLDIAQACPDRGRDLPDESSQLPTDEGEAAPGCQTALDPLANENPTGDQEF